MIVNIQFEPDMAGEDLADWLMAMAGGLMMEAELNSLHTPPDVLQ